MRASRKGGGGAIAPPKERGACHSAPFKTNSDADVSYLTSATEQARCETQWRNEAVRLRAEWRGTGNRRHLQALRRHLAGMIRQLRGKVVCP